MSECPEDILSNSLSTLYQYETIVHSSPGSLFEYALPGQTSITLLTPDTLPSNWSLHASSIWVASVFLADHINEVLVTPSDLTSVEHVHVLELGAGAGLPSIVLARLCPNVRVTVSDYPDQDIIRVLEENISRNGVSRHCRVIPYTWGTDVSPLLAAFPDPHSSPPSGFDLLLAADTIWSPQSHPFLVSALTQTLRRSESARAHLIAGLHTGRYTIQAFLRLVSEQGKGLVVESAVEREVRGNGRREWDLSSGDGAEDEERERRRWVVWIVLKWV